MPKFQAQQLVAGVVYLKNIASLCLPSTSPSGFFLGCGPAFATLGRARAGPSMVSIVFWRFRLVKENFIVVTGQCPVEAEWLAQVTGSRLDGLK